jgi:prepilin-type N-terminal cleavage/methylation domain-containing protein
MRRYLRRNERGFTLIELLIVVAILGFLAAIAIVNLITAQRRARYSRAAGDTREIITQALVVTSDYNQTPVTQLGLVMPQALWTTPTPAGGLPRLPLYMAPVTDPWAPGGVTYQFAEVAPPGGGAIDSGNVVFTSHTIGSDGIDNSGPAWNGQGPPGNDDLGNSTLIGCTFGPNIGISNPC